MVLGDNEVPKQMSSIIKAQNFCTQIVIVKMFLTHRRMKSVWMEKGMCVLTLIAIKSVPKPTN